MGGLGFVRFEAGANHSSEKASMDELREDDVRSVPRRRSQIELGEGIRANRLPMHVEPKVLSIRLAATMSGDSVVSCIISGERIWTSIVA